MATLDNAGNRRLCLGDYAEVVDTTDEFEGLIGVVEEFLDDDGVSQRSDYPKLSCIVLHIPTRFDGQEGGKLRRLRDVNELTSYVKQQLRGDDDRYCFPVPSVAWFDPDWL